MSGRDFTAEDTTERPAVAIVNQAFVRRVMQGGDPVGRRFRTETTRFVQVVGVVEDGKYEDLSDAAEPAIFEPATQASTRPPSSSHARVYRRRMLQARWPRS